MASKTRAEFSIYALSKCPLKAGTITPRCLPFPLTTYFHSNIGTCFFIIEAIRFLHKNCPSHFDTQAFLSFALLFQSFLQKKCTSFDKLWQLMIVATTPVCPNKFSSGWVSRLQRWYHISFANQMIRFHWCNRSRVIISEPSYNYETSVRKLLRHKEVAEWNSRKTWQPSFDFTAAIITKLCKWKAFILCQVR